MKTQQDKATTLFEKIAALTIGGIEDTAGIYLTDDREQAVRQMIEEEKRKSFALRHPWVTGIPTLGLAPAIAQQVAEQNIINTIARRDPVFRSALHNERMVRRREALEDYELETARLKAQQAERAMAQLAAGAIGATSMYANRNKREDNNIKY